MYYVRCSQSPSPICRLFVRRRQEGCKNCLIRKYWRTYREKVPFLQLPIAHKRFIFEHSYISYGKRQKSCTLIPHLSHFIVSDVSGFLIRRQNRPDILSAGEEVLIFALNIARFSASKERHGKMKRWLYNWEALGNTFFKGRDPIKQFEPTYTSSSNNWVLKTVYYCKYLTLSSSALLRIDSPKPYIMHFLWLCSSNK